MSSSFNTFHSNMSCSNAATTVTPVIREVTRGCERGFLAPPTVDMVPSTLPIDKQIAFAIELVEAYLVYNIFVDYPSPSFVLPARYCELVKDLPSASPQHVKYLHCCFNYCMNMASFFWEGQQKDFPSTYLHTNTSSALRAVFCHWDPQSVMCRIFLGVHKYLMKMDDLDHDPNPPHPFDPSAICMLRCSSGPPPGDDDYMYNGSYLMSIERCLGWKPGEYNVETGNRDDGEVPGFLRGFGYERVLPALQKDVDILVATYKSHPIEQFVNIFHDLGAPRHNYQLTPLPIQGTPTPDEEVILQRWSLPQSIRESYSSRRVAKSINDMSKEIPALQSDSRTSIALAYLARIAPTGRVFNPDESNLIASFLGTRLPDNHNGLVHRPRHHIFTNEAINTTAKQTTNML
jgi:hypothetical protein